MSRTNGTTAVAVESPRRQAARAKLAGKPPKDFEGAVEITMTPDLKFRINVINYIHRATRAWERVLKSENNNELSPKGQRLQEFIMRSDFNCRRETIAELVSIIIGEPIKAVETSGARPESRMPPYTAATQWKRTDKKAGIMPAGMTGVKLDRITEDRLVISARLNTDDLDELRRKLGSYEPRLIGKMLDMWGPATRQEITQWVSEVPMNDLREHFEFLRVVDVAPPDDYLLTDDGKTTPPTPEQIKMTTAHAIVKIAGNEINSAPNAVLDDDYGDEDEAEEEDDGEFDDD